MNDVVFFCLFTLPVVIGFTSNVQGEPVFSELAVNWFCEKSDWIGKVEDVKPVFLNFFFNKMDFNRQPFWGGGFFELWIVK